MKDVLGLPLEEALSFLPEGASRPVIVETSAPKKDGNGRTEGTLRVVTCRGNTWIAARFLDGAPREAEEQ